MRTIRSRIAVIIVAAGAMLASIAGPAGAIVGGEPVSSGAPWAAAFIKPGDGDVEGRFYCSGVLIKPQWVLTARHCRPAANDVVAIGRTRLASTQGERRTVDFTVVDDGVRVPVVRYMTGYPAYCPTNLDDRETKCDLALVRLNAPSTHPDLELADADEVSQWGVGTEALVYGYGVDHVGELRRARMRVVDLRDNHYTLFAQGINGVSCNGDSGAPLIVAEWSRAERVASPLDRRHNLRQKWSGIGPDGEQVRPGERVLSVQVGQEPVA